jgi:N-terminal acetyltransferase 2
MLGILTRRIPTANGATLRRLFSALNLNPLNAPGPRISQPSRLLRQPQRRLNSIEAKPSDALQKRPVAPEIAAEEDTKLPVSQRLKILFKKYRWPAAGIYVGLGILDFGIAFVGVKAFGTEKIGRYEKVILEKLEEKTGWKTKGTPEHQKPREGEAASIWTEIALAYTIHKTLFALIRVPLVVAITPAIVKWYQRRGIGAVLAQVPLVGRFFKNLPAAIAAKKGP